MNDSRSIALTLKQAYAADMIISRRTFVFSAIVGLALGTGAGFAIGLNRTSVQASIPTTSREAKAAAAKQPPACLADKKAVPSGAAQDALVRTMIAQLTDVAAGTNLDVGFTTDDGRTVTGSERYSSDWGSYNYSAERSGDGWRVTSLVVCTEK